jgi:hypothetical protein
MSCAIMSRPWLTNRLLTTGQLTSADDPFSAPIRCPMPSSRPAARRGSVRMLGSAAVAPVSRSYVRAGCAEPPGALPVGDTGARRGQSRVRRKR